MFFATNAVELESQELEYLEEHESESGGLPYFQVLTHPNEAVAKVKKSRPWGIYISTENAGNINLKPDSNWSPITFYTTESQGFANAELTMDDSERAAYEAAGDEVFEHTGWVSTTLMFHLIYQSQSEIEVKGEYQGKPSYKFVGLRWSGDDANREHLESLLKERDERNRPTHRWCQRYMFILVGADGNPLHDGVITWRSKGGAGGSFSSEMKELFKDLNAAYGEGKGNKRLNLFQTKERHCGDMRSFVRLAMTFDLYKEDKESAPYLVPVGRVLPTGDSVETKVREAARGKNDDRTVKLYPSLLIHGASTQMMVPQSSELGARIRTAIEEYASFPLPMQGKEAVGGDAAMAQGNRPYSGKGIIDAASLVTSPTGNGATLNLLTESGSIPVSIESMEDLDNIMGVLGNVSVTGTIPAAGGPVLVESWSADAPAAETAGQQALVEGF